MKIIMQEGKGEVTPEIMNIARGYDFNTMYIDSYTQMKQADERNSNIMFQLHQLGVETLDKDDN